MFPIHSRKVIKAPKFAVGTNEQRHQQDLAEARPHLGQSFKADCPGTVILSPCGAYRYYLGRQLISIIQWKRRAVWVLFNPSSATHEVDDHTSMKGTAFSVNEGCTDMDFLNLYGGRATKPKDIWSMADPVGPENDANIEKVFAELTDNDLLIFAWGSLLGPKMAERVSIVWDLAQKYKRTPMCLGLTKHGGPKHPLILSYKEKFRPITGDMVATYRRMGV